MDHSADALVERVGGHETAERAARDVLWPGAADGLAHEPLVQLRLRQLHHLVGGAVGGLATHPTLSAAIRGVATISPLATVRRAVTCRCPRVQLICIAASLVLLERRC